MPKPLRRALKIVTDENEMIHATWSRSGKRLIVTVGRPSFWEAQQVQLRPEQAETLARFLDETLASAPADR